jgi:purine-binding chemotaxis protein CheW
MSRHGATAVRTGRSGTAGAIAAPAAVLPVLTVLTVPSVAVASAGLNSVPAGIDALSAVAQIVTFRIEQDLFAADVRAVERVLRLTAVTPVRNMPAWVTGVLEYQKRVVPVIDFRARFELPAAAPTNETRALVFNVTGSWVAAVVDAVLDVSALERGKLEPPPPLFRGLAAEYLRGIVHRDGKLVMLLDADRLLSATERLALSALTDASSAATGTHA